MIFDVYYPFQRKDGKWCPGVEAKPATPLQIETLMRQPWLATRIAECRAAKDKDAYAEAKKHLPAVCFTGRATKGRRQAEEMEATQFVMTDIDHATKDPREIWQHLLSRLQRLPELLKNVLIVHVTPSGHGLRLVFRAVENYKTLKEHMEWINQQLFMSEFGDYDTAVKDLSRISYLVVKEDVLYWNNELFNSDCAGMPRPILNGVEGGGDSTSGKQQELFTEGDIENFTEEEKQKFEALEYRGFQVKIIIEKFVEVQGTPSEGEIHNFYNEMVKYFRCITSNNKRALLYLLPRFGHSAEECWSQIKSITRVNTLSSLPKEFYFFLKDHGFYVSKGSASEKLKEYMLEEKEEDTELPTYLPPVFRELVGTAPKDFVVPCVNALLPIMGTLTSYLRAVYPFDNREHSTSFFSVIYAPPGTGKGFVERFMETLFVDLRLRDFVQSSRENVYLRALNKRSQNEKAPDMPHTSLRLIPPKNSEAEFLQKQQDNAGYHMFTYAAEMDSWAKGVKAAGGNKDDMIRIAWDNGEYGQQFKSANTFKGMVHLYWNVLITGTLQQVENYFKNVENGLVTRCSFTAIENQEFAPPAIWKTVSKKGKEVIKNFLKRCDERTYETPCTINPLTVQVTNDDDFDKEVDWRFKFRKQRRVDMDWVMPTVINFLEEQLKLAARDIDKARDVFRRRVAVRGFRLGILCYGLWENPRPSDLQKCTQFIDWWMHQDIENMMQLWGQKYNELTDTDKHVVQRSVFDQLPDKFTRNDVYTVCVKQGIRTAVRRILFEWKKLGYIEQLTKQDYRKKGK